VPLCEGAGAAAGFGYATSVGLGEVSHRHKKSPGGPGWRGRRAPSLSDCAKRWHLLSTDGMSHSISLGTNFYESGRHAPACRRQRVLGPASGSTSLVGVQDLMLHAHFVSSQFQAAFDGSEDRSRFLRLTGAPRALQAHD